LDVIVGICRIVIIPLCCLTHAEALQKPVQRNDL